MKTIHYLDDRVIICVDSIPQYGFKIKGGKYGDLRKVARSESSRRGNKEGSSFNKTQFEYNGTYE